MSHRPTTLCQYLPYTIGSSCLTIYINRLTFMPCTSPFCQLGNDSLDCSWFRVHHFTMHISVWRESFSLSLCQLTVCLTYLHVGPIFILHHKAHVSQLLVCSPVHQSWWSFNHKHMPKLWAYILNRNIWILFIHPCWFLEHDFLPIYR